MYLCARGIHFTSLFDFTIDVFHTFFIFSFLSILTWLYIYFQSDHTLSQSGRPGCVFVFNPVKKSFLSCLWTRSNAIWSPTPSKCVFLVAADIYKCISTNCSSWQLTKDCSISKLFNTCMNHSKQRWSLFTHIKSTYYSNIIC